MKLRASVLAIIAAGALATNPSWAQRSGGHGGHGGHGHFWGPFGFLLGSAILYSAVQQPRTVYYTPSVVYAPPVYAPVTVQPYYVEPTYVGPPVVALPPPAQPPYASQSLPIETPPGGQWWYLCAG